MEISRKTDYAIHHAFFTGKKPKKLLSVRDAADENDIPYSFARSSTTWSLPGNCPFCRGAHIDMMLAIDPSEVKRSWLVRQFWVLFSFPQLRWAGPNNEPCPRRNSLLFWSSLVQRQGKPCVISLRPYCIRIVVEGLIPRDGG